jgi:hypothetical protein
MSTFTFKQLKFTSKIKACKDYITGQGLKVSDLRLDETYTILWQNDNFQYAHSGKYIGE